jgi:hypothetical protein
VLALLLLALLPPFVFAAHVHAQRHVQVDGSLHVSAPVVRLMLPLIHFNINHLHAGRAGRS